MKSTKVKIATLILGILIFISLSVLVIINTHHYGFASADASGVTSSDESDEQGKTVITDSRTIVYATYNFVRLNDSECSVKIANKAEATVAVIPNKGVIDGKEYSVTEIAANGFASSPKLERVRLSAKIKKINNSAFTNCAELQRVDLNRVETIGNNVFYKCLKLQNIRIPETVISVGSSVFRNNETAVHIVAAESFVVENWTSTWNSNNKSSEPVEYNTFYRDPVELETVYEENARSTAEEPIGYAYSAGQPVNYSKASTATFSNIDNGNFEDYFDENNNIIIPSHYDDGKPILKIVSNAFSSVSFKKCLIKYSDNPIEIYTSAFFGADGNEIIINRDVEFCPMEFEKVPSDIFSYSSIISIVLPDSLTGLPDSTFANCENLTNIFFETPNDKLSENDLLNLVDNLKNPDNEGIVYLPLNANFTTIGASAFEVVTTISELHINENVLNIGASAVSGWSNEEQKVKVHNTKAIPKYNYDTKTGWHPDWHDAEFKVEYDKYIFIISLDANEGILDGVNEKEVELNKKIGTLPIPHREGYRFDGWYNEGNDLVKEDTIYTEEKEITLTAKWSKEYIVELKSTYGEKTYYQVKAVLNEELPLKDIQGYVLQRPQEESRTFNGFWSQDGGVRYYDENMIPSKWYNEEHLVIYAKWDKSQITTYEIKYQVEGGFRNYYNSNPTSFTQDDVENNSFKFSTIVSYSSQPIQKLVWSLKCIKEAEETDYLETGTLTVSGRWVDAKAQVKIDLLGGTYNNPTEIILSYGERIELETPTRVGYAFVGWFSNDKKVESVYYNTIENIEIDQIYVYAMWEDRVTSKHVTIKSTQTSYSVTGGTDVTIVLPSGGFYNSCKIGVGSGVKNLHIYAETYRAYNMCIGITANSNINLYLENFELVAPESYPGIQFNNNYTLNLFTYGTVKIHGGNGRAGTYTNKDGGVGEAAIKGYDIKICHADVGKLYIYGGDSGMPFAGGKYARGGYVCEAKTVTMYAKHEIHTSAGTKTGLNYCTDPFPPETNLIFIEENKEE